MARIRSVHPGLSTDSRYAGLTPIARFFWIMLLTEADDNGIFKWEPKDLKIRLLPLDNVDASQILDELAEGDCVRAFSHNGQKFGAIRNFCKYQRPKSPKGVHFMPDELREYLHFDGRNSAGVGRPTTLTHQKSEKIGNRPTSATAISEKIGNRSADGGWRMEDGGDKREKNINSDIDTTAARVRAVSPDGMTPDGREVSMAFLKLRSETFPIDTSAPSPKKVISEQVDYWLHAGLTIECVLACISSGMQWYGSKRKSPRDLRAFDKWLKQAVCDKFGDDVVFHDDGKITYNHIDMDNPCLQHIPANYRESAALNPDTNYRIPTQE